MPVASNPPSFLDLVEAHKGIIFKVANAYCRDAENRKDLIQEIMVQLWLSFSKYDDRYAITTWMYRIALNVSISFYRKESRRGDINHPLPNQLLSLKEEEQPFDGQAAIDQLYRFIRDLKEIDRAVMLLYLEENDQQTIADILGLSVSNVSTKVGRIKQQLRKSFTQHKIDQDGR
ncbi:sigma-70 family RNA polymerase sigma factor [Paraflavitalea sp. CAU 1676]|uniref:RNA polymerase sigma factor n=1 Tax=Paraflavitalea sp. CAU 1676 TaxID=3032598 RepID=UPI0023D9FAF9|nr:sigma-70 family RNA polymerase sigma factor [Paraflavitalea sp. CAU 1676]MDF2188220.1 sigma-70 family RNA polymerase sigma factor [Paraflavitalea sp. CAU 1676]